MTTKLAGQRAKFSRARATYYTASDESARERAIRHMSEVLQDAPRNGFTEDEVTQGEEPPIEARRIIGEFAQSDVVAEESEIVSEFVDCSAIRRIGQGEQSVYVYGYRCAPDRLKVGSATGDPISRIAAQISTGTPDRPVAHLVIATHDCRALERVLHGVLRIRGKQVPGAGSEWFVSTVQEIETIYQTVGA